MMKIYYAHPIKTYGSKTESDDIAKIKEFMSDIEDVEIINPSDKEIQKEYDEWKETKSPEDHAMRFFKQIISDCDGLIFRGETSGVKYEIKKAIEFGIPVMDVSELY